MFGYKIRFSYIKFIEKCIREVERTEWINKSDKDFTLNNYKKVLQRLREEQGLFTKM